MKVTIGLFGLGSVGQGFVKILRDHPDIKATFLVLVRDRTKKRFDGEDLAAKDITLVNSADEIFESADVIVEVMGGSNGLAWDVIQRAIKAEKLIVTANKALIAEHMDEIEDLLNLHPKAKFRCEAAVAACLPILTSLSMFHNACHDPIEKIQGVLNGSTAYLINRMERTGESMDSIIADMKHLGYLEEDPDLDLKGIDAKHKLIILCRMAFGSNLKCHSTYGLPQLLPSDFDLFRSKNLKMRLIATVEKDDNELYLSVMPHLVDSQSAWGSLKGTVNRIEVTSKYAGCIAMEGPGAGSLATGHAVASDVVNVLQPNARGGWLFPPRRELTESVAIKDTPVIGRTLVENYKSDGVQRHIVKDGYVWAQNRSADCWWSCSMLENVDKFFD